VAAAADRAGRKKSRSLPRSGWGGLAEIGKTVTYVTGIEQFF
jgi:hypothetical protein